MSPLMWQQIDNLTGALGWQAREDVFQICN